MRTLLGLMLVCLVGWGCSDDGTIDADASVDAAPVADASTALNCTEINACAVACGENLACAAQCSESGCESGREAAETLTLCSDISCKGDELPVESDAGVADAGDSGAGGGDGGPVLLCAADPSGAACQACLRSKCLSAVSDCEENSCED